MNEYLQLVTRIIHDEAKHDATEQTAFDDLDEEIAARIEAAPNERVDALRILRLRLHSLHAKFRVRRAAIVAESASDLACAITVLEEAHGNGQ